MRFRFDLSSVEASPSLPPGTYRAAVKQVELREGKSSGKPYLNWTFQVLEPPFVGRVVYLTTSLQEHALFRLKEVFLALGEESNLVELEVDEDTNLLTYPQVVGREVLLRVGERPGPDGLPRPEVLAVLPAPKDEGAPARPAMTPPTRRAIK